jgi:hypothetical protein
MSCTIGGNRHPAYTEGRGRERFMRILCAAALIGLVAGPAHAQMPQLNLLQDNRPAKTQEEKDAEAATDKAYRESLRKIPDAKVTDPWGGVRSNDPPKAPAKSSASAKPRIKAGSTTGNTTN